MVNINKQMKEEICIKVERWKQGRLKLSKNKSLESVVPGDIVMLRRESKLDQPQFGLVLEVLNHSQDMSIRLQSGYCFTTAIGNLIPVASGEANSMDSQGSSRSGASRVGKPFTHFISASITGDGDLAQIRKYQETLESIPEIGKPKKTQKMHVTLACLCVSESKVKETEQKFQ